MTFGPALYLEVQYRVAQARGVRYTVKTPAQPSPLGDLIEHPSTPSGEQAPQQSPSFASVLTGSKEQVLVPKDTQFSILIPKIGANAKVIPNVDPSDERIFLPALLQGVAHAKGTVFPGQPGNIYLFSHSTDNFWDVGRYNAIFYLLKDVSVGDEVIVFFEGRRYDYTVTESKIVDPTDVSYIVHSRTNQETLILQTCWPPGTTWKRLLVIARPSSQVGK